MAKTTSSSSTAKERAKVVEKTPAMEVKASIVEEKSTAPNIEELMALMQSMAQQVSELTNKLNQTEKKLEDAEKKVAIKEDADAKEYNARSENYNAQKMSREVSPVLSSTSDKTDRLLEILANKKSDKEVVIVHNREMIGGLSTAIKLTGLTINFHKLGEERVLSWQQFEECVSKYRKFFDKEIILLGSDYEELSQRYSVPCAKRANNKIITREDLVNLAYMDTRQIEDYYNSLTEEDKAFICSYWLGKCYERDEKFYDRYKVETLNRLSKGVFDNVLAVMNNDFARRDVTTK